MAIETVFVRYVQRDKLFARTTSGKVVAGSLAIPLSLLFRTSYERSTLPTIWKSAIVTPVFKKGSPSSASNYI